MCLHRNRRRTAHRLHLFVARLERMPLSFLRQKHLATLQSVGENLTVLPVHQDHALWVAPFDKTNQVVVAGVRTEVELLPLAFDVDRDAVKVDHTFFDEAPAVRPFDLVTGKEDRASWVLPNHFQVPQDGSPVEHPTRRHDHLAAQCKFALPMVSHDVGPVHRFSQRLHRANIFRVLDVDRVHFLPHAVQPDLVPGMWPAGWAVTSRSPMSTLSPKSIVRYRRRAVRKSLSSNGASKPSASAIFRESASRRSATSAVGGVRTTSTSWRRVTHGIIPVWSRWAWLMNMPSTGGAGIGYCGGSRGRSP